MQRTITAKIPYDSSLARTTEVFNRAVQDCIDIGWEFRTFNKNELHEQSYRIIRKLYPDLQSSLVQCARDQASDILKRVGFKGDKPSKKLKGAVRHNARTYTPKLEDKTISISTVDGRKKFKILIPKYFRKYSKGKVMGMTLCMHEEFFLAKLVIEIDFTAPAVKKPKVMGIDCGINKIAVCSSNVFYASKELKSIKGRYFFLRKKLQRKGTRSATRLLRIMRGRETRFVADVNHRISKAVVNSNFNVFVFEKLEIRKAKNGKKKSKRNSRRFNRKLGSWSYAQLQRFTAYKAEIAGKQVLYVNPAFTSQTCSCCGACDKSFRHKNLFSCGKCKLNLDADLNASRNIAMLGKSLLGRVSVNDPYVSCHDAEGAKAQLRQSIVTSHLTC